MNHSGFFPCVRVKRQPPKPFWDRRQISLKPRWHVDLSAAVKVAVLVSERLFQTEQGPAAISTTEGLVDQRIRESSHAVAPMRALANILANSHS